MLPYPVAEESHATGGPGRRPVVAAPPGEGGALRTRIFTGRLRHAARLGTLAALLAVLAVPVIGASSASAYPGFTVSVTCTATNGQSGSQATWEWWQGGTGGKLLAIGSVRCPNIAGSGTSSTTGSGIQLASVDTLAFLVDSVAGNGCGGTGDKTISFTPGSSVSTQLKVTGKSPCSYAPGLKKDTVTVDASLQS
jgi:hypothetical protein